MREESQNQRTKEKETATLGTNTLPVVFCAIPSHNKELTSECNFKGLSGGFIFCFPM